MNLLRREAREVEVLEWLRVLVGGRRNLAFLSAVE